MNNYLRVTIQNCDYAATGAWVKPDAGTKIVMSPEEMGISNIVEFYSQQVNNGRTNYVPQLIEWLNCAHRYD